MNFREQKETLREAIRLLMALYQDVCGRAEPFDLMRGSELKKMPQRT